MTIASNYPTVAPSLNLDFANSQQLDPRISFTRAGTGTYYDGKTSAVAEQNLLLRSEDYSATWTVTNLTPVTGKTAPDTNTTATEFTASAANGVLTQSVTVSAGDYIFSVYLRRVTGTGNIDITAHSGGTWVTQSITSSWARYTVTQTLTAGARIAGVRVVTSGDVIEVWGCQIEQRSAATAYTATTTAAITNYIPQLLTAPLNTPRFDFNPTTRVSLGLRMEDQRTNLLLQSEDFSTTWSATRATVSTNINIAPTGALTADGLIASTDNDTHFVSQTFTGTAVSHTFTVYAKAYGLNFIALRLFNGTSQVGLAYYNLSTGAPGTVTAGTASIQSVGNNWYRCVLTATLAASASCTADIQLANADNTNSFTGNAFSGVTIWGAQLEAGAFATSYIPTVASQVTRSADAAVMTGTNFSSWFNQSEGTLYTETARLASNSDVGVSFREVTNGNLNNYRTVVIGNDQIFAAEATLSSTLEARLIFNALGGTSYFKVASGYKINDLAATVNGVSVLTDASYTPNPNLGLFIFSPNNAGGVNGYIKKIAYYPIRVTNANLQALTGS